MFERMKSLALAGSVLAAGLGAAADARAQQFINVLTGGTSGVYYPLGVALSEIYAEGIEGARTQVQATKASVENLNLLQQGKGEIAFTLGDAVALAAEGNTEAGFPGKLDKLRGIAAIYPNYIQIVASARRAASRRWPTSRARASRSARRSPAPSSTRARSSRPPA